MLIDKDLRLSISGCFWLFYASKYFLENSECMGILSIRSINKELYSGKFKVLDIKDLVMFREFDFVQLQGQDTGLPALFMQFANHYKEKL